ncbi:unnamed protein product [Parascedosporium putredinis]|uniref:Uncharacterized protein n=1 Tax=Parascedosporium putredinis TaxID=1442378 RepID=A0A9P1GW54_9PEZI|nr:unnamed protein product [Parascedosporium putredinis]CAI7989204.1 unnamed protein product [Parascedosporium putredinis]
MSAVGHLYTPPALMSGAGRNALPPGARPSTSGSPAEDGQSSQRKSQEEKRMRRRSMHTLDSADYPNPLTPQLFKRPGEMVRADSSPAANGYQMDLNRSLRVMSPMGPNTAATMSASTGESPAARRLAAINMKSGSKTSRLRRAFSFGSAAEFKKVAGAPGEDDKEPSKLHKEPTANELYDAEQERIAKKQEEGGLGSSIYGGRQTTVSMVTVEAERDRVNVNADPHTQPGGGTGFPRLERNSIDAARAPSMISERLGSSGTDGSAARKSIIGGDRERAEVLAAVRKGILKRRNGSPTRDPHAVGGLPGVPGIADSPNSSAPSTPNDEAMHGHRRSESIAIGSEDYFVSALRLRQDSKSGAGTPSSTSKRNATFSPRIVFYDTWPSQEYDRRGEIATCNRLTPMLAQQIKEELNSFKMGGRPPTHVLATFHSEGVFRNSIVRC